MITRGWCTKTWTSKCPGRILTLLPGVLLGGAGTMRATIRVAMFPLVRGRFL